LPYMGHLWSYGGYQSVACHWWANIGATVGSHQSLATGGPTLACVLGIY
jgi:hypothetical protein